MFRELLPYLAVGFLFVAIANVLGHLLVKYLFRDFGGLKPFSQLFFDTLVGAMALVAIYSIAVTGFKTVNICFLFIFGFLAWENRKLVSNQTTQQPNGGAPRLLVYGFAMLAFVLFSLLGIGKIYTGGEFPWVVYLGDDYAYHSMLSETLSLTGYENKFVPEQMFGDGFPGIHLFHFFDLWLASGLAKLAGLNNYVMQNTVVDPFFMMLSGLGFLALCEQVARLKPVHYVLGLLVLGFGYLHLTLYNVVPYLSPEHYRIHHFGASVLALPKLFQVVPFAFAIAYFLLKERYAQMTLWVMALAVVYMSAIPVMLASTFVLLVGLRLLKQLGNRELLVSLAYIAFAGVFFFLLYKLLGTGISEGKDKLDLDLFGMGALKTRINITGLTVMQTVALFLPHLVLLAVAFWLGRKNLKAMVPVARLLGYAAIVFAMGLLAWVAAFKNQDGMQLLGNNFPVINVLLLLALVMLYFENDTINNSLPAWARKAAPWVLVVFAAANYFGHISAIPVTKAKKAKDYDPKYLTAIAQSNADAEKPLIGVFFKGDKEYSNNSLKDAHRTSQSYKLGMYTVFMPQYLTATSLSIFEMPRSKDELNYLREENAISGSSFYGFVERQKAEGKFTSIAQSQADFIGQYHIGYGIVSSSANVPAEVLGKAKQVITDPVSGERFLLF